MLCGKPSVTFHIEGSGVNNLCRNNIDGIECIEKKPESLAAALEKLADNYELRVQYGNNAKNHILRIYNKENFTTNLIKVLFDNENKQS